MTVSSWEQISEFQLLLSGQFHFTLCGCQCISSVVSHFLLAHLVTAVECWPLCRVLSPVACFHVVPVKSSWGLPSALLRSRVLLEDLCPGHCSVVLLFCCSRYFIYFKEHQRGDLSYTHISHSDFPLILYVNALTKPFMPFCCQNRVTGSWGHTHLP